MEISQILRGEKVNKIAKTHMGTKFLPSFAKFCQVEFLYIVGTNTKHVGNTEKGTCKQILACGNHEAKAWVELIFQAKLKLFKVAIQINNFKDIK